MIRVDPSPILFYFIFIFLFDPSWSESIRVDPTQTGGPSWSGPTFVPACFVMFYFPVFLLFSFGGGGVGVQTFSLKLPSIRYQKIKIPIFEDFFKNENLTKICFKMIFYKDHHRMITPNSNIFQRQYNIDPMPHNLFWNQESRISKNSVKTMKEWLKPLTVR